MTTLYIDMDGVLADFNAEPDGVKRFRTEKGFFYNLKPMRKNVKAVKKVIADGMYNLYILSASPNAQADADKIAWLKKYLPRLKKSNIILCRNGDKKVDFMKSPDGTLFDDYGKNLQEWMKGNKNNGAWKINGDGDLAEKIEMEIKMTNY